MRSGIFGALLLFVMADPGTFLYPDAKPGEVFTRITPKIALTKTVVTLYVEIPNPSPEMYCPEVRVELWGEPLCQVSEGLTMPCSAVMGVTGSVPEMIRASVVESDCEPWRDQPAIIDGEFVPSSKSEPFFLPFRFGVGQGSWELRATIRQGDKRVYRVETIEVR